MTKNLIENIKTLKCTKRKMENLTKILVCASVKMQGVEYAPDPDYIGVFLFPGAYWSKGRLIQGGEHYV